MTFPQSFQLTGMDKMLPAGTYEVTTEEEQIGDFVYEAYRRISTSIYLPRSRAIMESARLFRSIQMNWLTFASAPRFENPEEST